MQIILSTHACDMLKERNIPEKWLWQVVENYDRKEIGIDNNTHYFGSIAEHDGRILHVVINQNIDPHKIVTVFFDRGARRKK